jgi:transposase-like protein
MTRPYSIAFKQKMVERLTGRNAVSAIQLAQETGIRQQNLSRWLQEARSLPYVATSGEISPRWSVERKAQLLAEASPVPGGRNADRERAQKRSLRSPVPQTARSTAGR